MSIASEITRLQNAKADIKSSIEAKGVSVPSSAKIDTYDTYIEQISGGSAEVEEKDVNFHDYDGTITNSYTAQEFLQLETLPPNPTHNGLTAQGWNYSLADAKTYVQNYGMLEVGQMYITDDGSTRIYMNNEVDNTEFVLVLSFSGGSIDIDFGDNTSIVTTTEARTIHTYANKGKYVITITPSSSVTTMTFPNNLSSYGSLISSNHMDYDKKERLMVTNIELGVKTTLSNYSFSGFRALETLTIPNHITSIGSYCFTQCYRLKYLVIPNSCTTLSQNMISIGVNGISFPSSSLSLSASCIQYSNIKRITLPLGATSLNQSALANNYVLEEIIAPDITFVRYPTAFNNNNSLRKLVLNATTSNLTSINNSFTNCHRLKEVKIPKVFTSITMSSFNYCYSLKKIDLTEYTTIPTCANTTQPTNASEDYKIVVPNDLYDTWITTGNWSSFASHIVKESDYSE